MSKLSQELYRMQNKQRGFTLIELMIVVAVVAVLALIAYPSYIDSVRKGKRGQAKADILSIAETMERCYTQNSSYLLCWSAGTSNALPAGLDQSPTQGAPNYTVAMAPATTLGTFTVTATPVGDQANDKCGVLTLNQTGLRTANGSTTASSVGSPCF